MRTNRKLAAILFADIVGYTALMQQNETNAATLLRRFQQEMESMVSRHNGRIINFYGDGVLCVFDNPQEALRCAMAVQTNFRETPQVPVRMAVHSGTVVFEGDKIYGDSVNLTSRLESLGIAGAVLCSKKVRDEIKNQPDFELAGAYTLLGEKEKAYEWLEKHPVTIPSMPSSESIRFSILCARKTASTASSRNGTNRSAAGAIA